MRCEKNHKIPQTIASARHIPIGQNGAGHPISITVHMSDGQEVTYKR